MFHHLNSIGQQTPAEEIKRAQNLSESAEMFVVVGTSLQVQRAASFPVIAKQKGAFPLIINRDPTPLDDLAEYNFRGGA